ncbi:MAG TPA: 3-hydroxybutyrate oligomer hydrolase family protein [Egibacteraceae bacterium]|nr:3-hydroxybutyrate oligomer hydrolase family protein [Egibacteraceae bacterium]
MTIGSASALVREHSDAVERAAAVHQRLTDVVLEGGDLGDVAAALAEVLEGTLTVVDGNGRVVAGDSAAALDDLAGGLARTRALGRTVDVAGGAWITPVVAGAEQLGALVLAGRSQVAAADLRTLERAAQVAALVLLNRRSVAEAEHRLRGQFLSGNTHGRPLLTLHGSLDALLPISTDSDVYARRVRAAGHGDRFRYYVVEGGTHVDTAADRHPDVFRPIFPCFRDGLELLDAWVAEGSEPPPSGFVAFPEEQTPQERANSCRLPAPVDRVAGSDRVGTAVRASRQGFGIVGSVVVATAAAVARELGGHHDEAFVANGKLLGRAGGGGARRPRRQPGPARRARRDPGVHRGGDHRTGGRVHRRRRRHGRGRRQRRAAAAVTHPGGRHRPPRDRGGARRVGTRPRPQPRHRLRRDRPELPRRAGRRSGGRPRRSGHATWRCAAAGRRLR